MQQRSGQLLQIITLITVYEEVLHSSFGPIFPVFPYIIYHCPQLEFPYMSTLSRPQVITNMWQDNKTSINQDHCSPQDVTQPGALDNKKMP